MNDEVAVLFVDALPFALFPRVAPVDRSSRARPMRSGLGYSVNAKAELFAGLQPDLLGLLNEWTFRESSPSAAAKIMSPVDSSPRLSWLIRRMLRKIRGSQINNIPFEASANFERIGTAAYEREFGFPTAIDRYDKVLYSSVRARDRDSAVASYLLELARTSRKPLFGAFPDLDRSLHESGFSGAFLDQKLVFYKQVLADMLDVRPNLLLVSDHGMSPVDRLIDIWAEARVLARDTGCHYFLDSTMVRVWARGGETREWDRLLSSRGMTVLTEAERVTYGATSRRFGDLIAFAPEGSVLSPNFYGRVRNFEPGKSAMHGYHPGTSAQMGVIAGFGKFEARVAGRAEWSPMDVYRLLLASSEVR